MITIIMVAGITARLSTTTPGDGVVAGAGTAAGTEDGIVDSTAAGTADMPEATTVAIAMDTATDMQTLSPDRTVAITGTVVPPGTPARPDITRHLTTAGATCMTVCLLAEPGPADGMYAL